MFPFLFSFLYKVKLFFFLCYYSVNILSLADVVHIFLVPFTAVAEVIGLGGVSHHRLFNGCLLDGRVGDTAVLGVAAAGEEENVEASSEEDVDLESDVEEIEETSEQAEEALAEEAPKPKRRRPKKVTPPEEINSSSDEQQEVQEETQEKAEIES